VNIDELVAEMKRGPVSLFYGAGATLTCGGLSWDQLFSSVKNRFPGGNSNNFFEYMQEIIGYDNSNRAEIEDFVRKLLASVSAKDEQRYLFSIPWRAVLTTNYDSLPESINVTLDGNRQIIPITSSIEPINQMREDHLYCFKLLGDCKYNFPQDGWMALSTSDLFTAADRRARFIEKFRNLAVSGHIVYLGCSFKDELVFLLLSQMKTMLRHFPWKGFAIMPSEPEADVLKKLQSVGITWVRGTLENFVLSAKKVFGERPQSAPVNVGIATVHRQSIDLDRSLLVNIWKKFRILSDDLMVYSSETPIDFLRGICNTFYPYVLNLDYRRKANIIWTNPRTKSSIPAELSLFNERTTIRDLDSNTFIALVGIAGSGKTVVVNRLAVECYQKGNPVIFINPETTSIDYEALDSLLDEIREKYITISNKSGIHNPPPIRWLIVADDCGSLLPELNKLKNHLLSKAKPNDLILVARESETPIERLKDFEIDAVYKLDDTIGESDRNLFLHHFKRFRVMDEDIVNKNLEDREVNSSFFGLIYSSISHSRKTIKRLLEEEYDSLDIESKRIYRVASLIHAFRVSPLVSLIIKSGNIDPDWLFPQLKKGSLSGVLHSINYGRSLIAPNRLIAETICKVAFRTAEDRKLTLNQIISTVTFEDLAEMTFLDNLLNGSIEGDIGPKFSLNQKIDLFRQAVNVVRSRPLLIHLGRLETNAHRFSDARKTFKDAYGAHVERFDERIEHVRDAEGRLEFAIAEAATSSGDDSSAWEHLDEAEEKFVQAKINPRITPHPYEGLGRTYLTKAHIAKEKGIQWEFALAAIQECNYVEKYLGETSEVFVLKKEIENLLDIIGFNETHIEKIGSRIGKANGYAYLAEKKIARGRLAEALNLVEKGLKIDPMCLWLMRLRVSLLRKLAPDSHSEIMETLDDYAAISYERYDIELSFELAKETYISGNAPTSRKLFKELFRKAKHHPRRLIPREPEDRWIEDGKPKRLNGTIIKLPTEDRYGQIKITFPTPFRGYVVVRKRDIQFSNPRVGDRVNLEIVFNMFGPEASRVRPI
jgi:tetratricopeptide (TPR) repeat protein/GTPase SAR1 family protein